MMRKLQQNEQNGEERLEDKENMLELEEVLKIEQLVEWQPEERENMLNVNYEPENFLF